MAASCSTGLGELGESQKKFLARRQPASEVAALYLETETPFCGTLVCSTKYLMSK